MNKKILVALCFMTFISCKKKHNCACNNPRIEFVPIIIKDTLKNAKRICNDYNVKYNVQDPQTTCKLYRW